MLEQWEQLDARDKKLDTEHDKEVTKIRKEHDLEESILHKQQAEYAPNLPGHGDEATRELNANRELREQRLAKAEEEYQQKKAEVAKEKQDLNQFVEDRIQPERNSMQERHALETAACEEVRRELPNKSDVSFERRAGDWVRTVGPLAAAAYNKIVSAVGHPEYRVEAANWDQIGTGVQTGLTIISDKTGIPWPMSPREFDEAMLKGVKEIQNKEWADLAAGQATQLEVRNKSMEQLIEFDRQR
jgi:flagellar biosynthesis GTPase FlhF